nr:PREDICTED: uncharacterized protein C16orf86 homolog [Latimeria chalumnae]|eukprot:XP_014342026.1 PREDICTED: uncharacterized protein C16orf86 homolog [Latimeria chalumnae]
MAVSDVSDIKKTKKSPRKLSTPKFLSKLADILEDPELKAFKWDGEGKSVVVNAKTYEEEIQKHEDLLFGLKNFRSMAMLHGLLCTYGFKKKMAKADAEVHIFQHPDFSRKCPVKKSGNDAIADLVATPQQQKKSKKRQKDGTSTQHTFPVPAASSGTGNLELLTGKQQQVRLLYQYINYSNPEFNTHSEEDMNTEGKDTLANTPADPEKTNEKNKAEPDLQLTGAENKDDLPTLANGSPESLVKSELDKTTQVDIDKMLSVCTAPLVPPLSPQHQ